MSKTKEEYMELAYKDGLAGFFAQLNEQGTTDYGIFDGTVTKQIPECAITSVKYHQAKTLQLDVELDDEDQLTLVNAVWPAGLDKEELVGGLVSVRYVAEEVEDTRRLRMITSVTIALSENVTGNWYMLHFADTSDPGFVYYERSSGVVVLSDTAKYAFDTALKTYLDSLS